MRMNRLSTGWHWPVPLHCCVHWEARCSMFFWSKNRAKSHSWPTVPCHYCFRSLFQSIGFDLNESSFTYLSRYLMAPSVTMSFQNGPIDHGDNESRLHDHEKTAGNLQLESLCQSDHGPWKSSKTNTQTSSQIPSISLGPIIWMVVNTLATIGIVRIPSILRTEFDFI